jgi:hypothetical protein
MVTRRKSDKLERSFLLPVYPWNEHAAVNCIDQTGLRLIQGGGD